MFLNKGIRKLTYQPTKDYNIVFPNPLLGESEGEIRRNRNKDTYSKYLRESIKDLYKQKAEQKLKLEEQKRKERQRVLMLQSRNRYDRDDRYIDQGEFNG